MSRFVVCFVSVVVIVFVDLKAAIRNRKSLHVSVRQVCKRTKRSL